MSTEAPGKCRGRGSRRSLTGAWSRCGSSAVALCGLNVFGKADGRKKPCRHKGTKGLPSQVGLEGEKTSPGAQAVSLQQNLIKASNTVG